LQFSQRQRSSSGITFFLQSGQLRYRILSSLKMILMYPLILKNLVAEGRELPLEFFFCSSRSSSINLKLSLRSTEVFEALDPTPTELVVPLFVAPFVTAGVPPVTESKFEFCWFFF
jgi:hypothetical protein